MKLKKSIIKMFKIIYKKEIKIKKINLQIKKLISLIIYIKNSQIFIFIMTKIFKEIISIIKIKKRMNRFNRNICIDRLITI